MQLYSGQFRASLVKDSESALGEPDHFPSGSFLNQLKGTSFQATGWGVVSQQPLLCSLFWSLSTPTTLSCALSLDALNNM